MSARDIIEWEGLEPGDLDELLKLEREIGFELPERYKQIAAKYDGARPVKKQTSISIVFSTKETTSAI